MNPAPRTVRISPHDLDGEMYWSTFQKYPPYVEGGLLCMGFAAFDLNDTLFIRITESE